jgi:hypothetical protein
VGRDTNSFKKSLEHLGYHVSDSTYTSFHAKTALLPKIKDGLTFYKHQCKKQGSQSNHAMKKEHWYGNLFWLHPDVGRGGKLIVTFCGNIHILKWTNSADHSSTYVSDLCMQDYM